jgi:hypothetical protein
VTPEAAKRRAQALRERAAQLIAEAEAFEELSKTLGRLHSGNESATVSNITMETQHRLAIASGRGGKGGKLRAAAIAAGHSFRSLAPLVGVTHVYLSQIDRGMRPLQDDLAGRLHALIGWPKK